MFIYIYIYTSTSSLYHHLRAPDSFIVLNFPAALAEQPARRPDRHPHHTHRRRHRRRHHRRSRRRLNAADRLLLLHHLTHLTHRRRRRHRRRHRRRNRRRLDAPASKFGAEKERGKPRSLTALLLLTATTTTTIYTAIYTRVNPIMILAAADGVSMLPRLNSVLRKRGGSHGA